MAVVQQNIKQQIEQLVESTSEKDPEIAKQEFYNGLATIIQNAILSGQVTVQPGQIVSTPAGPGTVTSPGTGTIS